ncbi:methionine-gamma-lyase [Herbihabitans rhizosphaerae]|uniref:homocysteine desulfhydrase n=1 Tax=Herbihabitans rhizosphaerae TaxID=1872711 RepID=A0A4V2ERV9_9PSEU|nr:aminotransferase class I/II-fold pyridoxal phosphate-dependent enzyme [Herbihabitans rhizosphaerae]RZS34227.1 methionine-gamma-lyase [Herbihabitans rhizosphaerae]
MTHFETRAARVGANDQIEPRSISVPIFQSSTFSFDDPRAVAEALRRPDRGYVYSRLRNPTVAVLEKAVADLEGGTDALAAGSGMGAINTVLLSLLRAGDHVIAQTRLYGGTFRVLSDLAERFGVEITYISGTDVDEFDAAVRPETKVLYLETIANPTTAISDLPGLLQASQKAGVTSVVDNTFATPVLCRPIEYGADIVVHSATKYLGGHDDVCAGIAVFADNELYLKVWNHAIELGAAIDPFAAWLVLRGLKTLPLRVARHCSNAAHLAQRLAVHPGVSAVHWPGLPEHPNHLLATRVLDHYGGVLAFEVAGGRGAAEAVLGRLTGVLLAPSLGGPETLVLHPASTSHRELDSAELEKAGIQEGLIRVSVGLEHPEDLWNEFEQALKE